MKPYRKSSLYSFRFIRRLVYGRGFGVHSPFAYNWINSIIRPRGQYYIEKEAERISRNMTWGSLWFRLIARNLINTCSFDLQETNSEKIARELYHLAGSSKSYQMGLNVMGLDPISVLLSDRPKMVANSDGYEEQGMRVTFLINIRKDKERERDFLFLVKRSQKGIIIDLYDHALIIDKNRALYFYRSSI